MGGSVAKERLSTLTEHLPSSLHVISYHCAMLGLDSAGKTTVLYRLKFDQGKHSPIYDMFSIPMTTCRLFSYELLKRIRDGFFFERFSDISQK
jgi:hypothetical protein